MLDHNGEAEMTWREIVWGTFTMVVTTLMIFGALEMVV